MLVVFEGRLQEFEKHFALTVVLINSSQTSVTQQTKLLWDIHLHIAPVNVTYLAWDISSYLDRIYSGICLRSCMDNPSNSLLCSNRWYRIYPTACINRPTGIKSFKIVFVSEWEATSSMMYEIFYRNLFAVFKSLYQWKCDVTNKRRKKKTIAILILIFFMYNFKEKWAR